MIKIDQISNQRLFPTIDFHFVNSGRVSSVLTDFTVIVKNITIDPTPTIGFEASSDYNGNLIIKATNYGYGTAHDCQIKISHPYFDSFFTPEDLSSLKIDIPAGKSVDIATLSGKKIDSLIFKKLATNFATTKKAATQIQLENIRVNWKCIGENKKMTNGNFVIQNDHTRPNYLTENGFKSEFYHISACIRLPSQIYCVILDADQGAHTRNYNISREIKAGEADRFHIVVGTTKSASVELEFQFKSNGEIVQSQLFQIEIWNPRNSTHRYRDSDVYSADKYRRYFMSEDDEMELSPLNTSVSEEYKLPQRILDRLGSIIKKS